MSYRPLTYFTAISVAAHAALFGLGAGSEPTPPASQESVIEIGLLTLPRIDHDFTRDLKRPQNLPSPRPTTSTPQKQPPRKSEHRSIPSSSKAVRSAEPTEQKTNEQPEPANHAASGAKSADTSPVASTEAAPLSAKNTAPQYPARALRYGWEGEVWLKVDVSRDGSVSNVSVDQSSGYPILDKAALKTVRHWQFEPARVGSETTEGSVRVPIRFRIERS